MFRLNLAQFQSQIPIKVFENVITNNLGLNDEHLLILGDKGYAPNRLLAPILTNAFSLAANHLGITHSTVYQTTKARGEQADLVMLKQLKNLPPKSTIIINVSNRLGQMGYLGSSFRKFCAIKGHRFISTASMGMINNGKLGSVIRSLDVDAKQLQKKAEKVKRQLDSARELHIQTKAGTDLSVKIETRKAHTAAGIYTEPGKGGNAIPAETYIAPDARGANGKVVIDGSIRTTNKTHIVHQPASFEVKDSNIISWNKTTESKLLQESIKWAHTKSKHPWGIRRIGEIGIGLNENASIVGSTIIDEKTANTAHVAIGSNSWFGGDVYSIIHLDQVFKNPIFKIDGRMARFH